MEKRFENIKNELFLGGGYSQALFLLELLICDDNVVKVEDLLRVIGRNFDRKCEQLSKDSIIPIDRYDYLAKEGRKYVCLDNDLKFCILEKGKDEWVNAKFIFPYFDIYKAAEICKVNLI